MHKRFRQVFCALKEHTSVSYAKIATFGGFCDVDLIIIKATAPDDLPLPEKYMHKLMKRFSFSTSSFHSFSLSFTRRFGNTRSWKVALKCLILLHRLLRSLPEDSPFRAELFWIRSNGLLSLYPCHFQDDSSSNPEGYTVFIRSYAQLLDQALDCFSLDNKATEEEVMRESLQHKVKQVSRKLELLPRLQSLIDRVMDCIPIGVAPRSLIVQLAMKHIIRDSFICYTSFRREIVLVLDTLLEMPYKSCVSAFGIYKKAALQARQLCEFYEWCKAKGFCGSYEYPFIDRIPLIHIQALETFLNGMWQLTDHSSSLTTSPSSWVEFKSNSTEHDDQEKQVAKKNTLIEISSQMERSEENGYASNLELGKEEVEPLIQLEDGEDDNWEALLEASLNFSSHDHRMNFLIYPNSSSNGYGDGQGCENQLFCLEDHAKREDQDQWQLQANPNPFCQPCSNFPSFNGSAWNPAFPLGF
ncbi:hypothetical protein SADUNF_Sadunf10G0061900 [Salix dunnii]|uniref:ENTH domain-containing protein n=1 Tax=Salix dunnii TaxID=1413687 RepID=A0A835JM64_9ROSI|nr:hypothetical protein SADUNF_Sadunf10G0061900 [Salix dunnii]